jgi:hypothetical protein
MSAYSIHDDDDEQTPEDADDELEDDGFEDDCFDSSPRPVTDTQPTDTSTNAPNADAREGSIPVMNATQTQSEPTPESSNAKPRSGKFRLSDIHCDPNWTSEDYVATLTDEELADYYDCDDWAEPPYEEWAGEFASGDEVLRAFDIIRTQGGADSFAEIRLLRKTAAGDNLPAMWGLFNSREALEKAVELVRLCHKIN